MTRDSRFRLYKQKLCKKMPIMFMKLTMRTTIVSSISRRRVYPVSFRFIYRAIWDGTTAIYLVNYIVTDIVVVQKLYSKPVNRHRSEITLCSFRMSQKLIRHLHYYSRSVYM